MAHGAKNAMGRMTQELAESRHLLCLSADARYALVPKVVKEDEFWRNYFYRVNLIKESFDLEDIQDPEVGAGDKPKEDRLAMPDDEVHHQQEGQG